MNSELLEELMSSEGKAEARYPQTMWTLWVRLEFQECRVGAATKLLPRGVGLVLEHCEVSGQVTCDDEASCLK